MFLYLSRVKITCSVSVRMILLKLLWIFAGIAIKEHILQLTPRENALVIRQRGKPELFLSITVHVSTCGCDSTYVDMSVACALIITTTRSV